ncbi:hypothetical protein Pmani_004212 [Petrolisthes manimaculis]|uniref:Uncharacterized protein n=1 Tax=Petrolisthes manimaculis TaxID=1843537 RepID=A0AAE1QH29_9EUCA|nr:hypothetical protein Pmani_004212 [Petrolisthes manimaculis]
MILSLLPDTALENYVQVGGMAGSSWVDGGGGGEWDPSDQCECGGPPPPTFMLPPPPRPPPPPEDSPYPYHVPESCEDPPFTCPSFLGAREDHRPQTPRAPLAVVLVSAATLVILVVMAAIIVCRLRGRGRTPKGCTELSGAIIYDDLPSAPSIVPARAATRGPRFKPVPVDGEEMMGMTMGVHLYTPEPRSHPPSEHLYQSISSGSETCSYSTSDATGQDGRALLRPHLARSVRAGGGTLGDTDSEEEPLAALAALGEPSDNDTPSMSPAHSHSRYYCPSAPPRTHSPGSDYESVYYVGGMRRGRPATPQERGLPPLPSRTDRFRIYFSVDRGGQPRPAVHRRPDRRHNLHHSHPPEAEPLYENLT